MPITMIIKGTKEDAMRESEKRALAFIMLEKYQPYMTTGEYTKVTIIDTEENHRKLTEWYGDSKELQAGEQFPNGTLLHYSFGGRDNKPDVTKVEVQS